MKNRPYVMINTKNLIKDFEKVLEKDLTKFKNLNGLVGITLNGGLSRGYGDELSEIDITIFLNKETYENWQKNIAPITIGITKINGYLYDIKICNYDEELLKKYDDTGLWDLSYAKILFDPKGKIKILFDSKLENEIDINKSEKLMMSSWWNYKLAGDIWIKRSDYLQCNMMLDEGLYNLIKALFVANNEYIPHQKWLIHLSYSLNWKPENWKEKIKTIFSAEISLNGMINKQKNIKSLWEDIDNYLNNKHLHLPVHAMQKSFYEMISYLMKRKSLTFEEWEEKYNIDILNFDPFHKIITIKDNKIILDFNKINVLSESDMYSWHWEVLRSGILCN